MKNLGKRGYILMRSKEHTISNWDYIDNNNELECYISFCNDMNADYIIIFGIESEWIDDDAYYLGGYESMDEIWEKLFVDYRED